MNEIIIYSNRGKLFVLGFLSFVFVVVGSTMYTSGGAEEGAFGLWLRIIGLITILFFGLCMIYYIKVLIKRKPALIVSDKGITDHSSYIGAGLVNWEEIAGVDFVSFGGQHYIGIYTKDPELIINRASGLKRVLNRMNKGLLDTQVNIPVKTLDCSVEELVDSINTHLMKEEA
ncbi:STM3941 family protein [Ornithinibacillus salinisoli]|uniref:STM3941 family protein n=1 Tax=Ornithinibacillus salinisoli TaxID=1848459 RepID=A0ABW4VTY8_9BACI